MLSEGLQITENNIQLGRESRDLNDNIRKRRTEIEAEALIGRKSIAIVSKRESIGQDLTKDRNKDKEVTDKDRHSIDTKGPKEAQATKNQNQNLKKLKNQRKDPKLQVGEVNLATSYLRAVQTATDYSQLYVDLLLNGFNNI